MEKTTTAAHLRVTGVRAGYGGVQALRGVDLELEPGKLVALIGPNGAGKSTLLKCITGLVRPRSGEVRYGDRLLNKVSSTAIATMGVCQVPEGRRLFGNQSIADNLVLGAWVRRGKRREVMEDRERMYDRFPILRERRNENAASLSGGEAQMLAIAMALMARPKILLLDEPSLGLAPMLVNAILEQVRSLADSGVGVLLVEQMVHKALAVADNVYVLGQGRVMISGPAAEVANDPAVKQVYLGSG